MVEIANTVIVAGSMLMNSQNINNDSLINITTVTTGLTGRGLDGPAGANAAVWPLIDASRPIAYAGRYLTTGGQIMRLEYSATNVLQVRQSIDVANLYLAWPNRVNLSFGE